MNKRITKAIFVERLCQLILITDIPVKIGRFMSTVTFSSAVGNLEQAKIVVEKLGLNLNIEVESE
jgi:hypothetical protein